MGEASATIDSAVSSAEASANKIKAYWEMRSLGHLLPEAALQNIRAMLTNDPKKFKAAAFYAIRVIGAAQVGVMGRSGYFGQLSDYNGLQLPESNFTRTAVNDLRRQFITGERVCEGDVSTLFGEIRDLPPSAKKDGKTHVPINFQYDDLRHYFGLNGF